MAERRAAEQRSVSQQLAHLKAMRSDGRVALALPTRVAELKGLPDLPLEDGDHIYVPSKPSFVAAYGAVNNQNVIVYREGQTVSDLMALAGLTAAAQTDQSFILRADGTVVAANQNNGWSSSGNFEALELVPGDALVVPTKLDQESTWSAVIRNSIDITQILSNLGLGLAALRSL